MAAAASGALPGETLYPIKRGIEQVTTAAHFGDAAQGRALLGQAATRLDEVRALQAEGNADPDVISQTMDAFRTAADSGSEKLFSSYQSSGDQADITAGARLHRRTDGRRRRDVDGCRHRDQRPAASTPPTPWPTSTPQARDLCGACAPTKPLASPNALSAGAGAATVANLLASPVSQVKTEAATIAAARAARIKALRANAESQASKFPLLPAGTNPDGTPNYSFPGTPGSAENPITNVITPDGKLLPTVTSGAAVKDLVTGVTGTLSTVTGGATDPDHQAARRRHQEARRRRRRHPRQGDRRPHALTLLETT